MSNLIENVVISSTKGFWNPEFLGQVNVIRPRRAEGEKIVILRHFSNYFEGYSQMKRKILLL